MRKPSLANANFKRFMRKPELRIEKLSLYDLFGQTGFGCVVIWESFQSRLKMGI
ncbi:conserved hypothetical protein [Vibrio crassostreae]|nr:conserved hypothetical protein [Vibrio crassostreae]CAK1943840.1 conserved hypothetical protein [Vibrio crassostreae]CAK1945371.1 conserved hypothetical protein [Vibrio crassostreae]CAK1960425.1 conserved hypothetical protein [Vibrio crassostreae]CAK2038413.1 conserved hypothetical protein [Vibrio crassostreae]